MKRREKKVFPYSPSFFVVPSIGFSDTLNDNLEAKQTNIQAGSEPIQGAESQPLSLDCML